MMNNSTLLVQSQISQNLPRGYHESVNNLKDTIFGDITTYSNKNYPESYLFFIYVLLFLPPHVFYRCMGSLLTNNWVLTAARCTASYNILVQNVKCIQTKTGDYGQYFDIRRNTPLSQEVDLPDIEERSIKNLVLHPYYNSSMGYYDLALMKVTKGFSHDLPIQVLEQPIKQPITNCWVIGIVFEHKEDLKIDTVIKTINNVTISLDKIIYKLDKEDLPVGNPILRAVYGYKKACQGEPGVPLICNGKLVGVSTSPGIFNPGLLIRPPQLVYLNNCEVKKEYYYNYIVESIDWVTKYLYSDGYISIYCTSNWVLIILPLISLPLN